MLKNPLLQQALAASEKNIKDRSAYDRIVTAGTKAIYNQETFPELIAGLEKAPDPVEAVAEGIIGVLGMLFQKSRKTMPIAPMIQAGLTLLLDAMDFLEQAGKIEVTKETVAQATSQYLEALTAKLGLDKQMDGMLARLQPVMQDPQRMAQYKQSQGAA
jgi:hypothetical protein